jgi:hypothetical protein
VALTTTDNDNGFATMYFLFIPAIAALITVQLSWWIPDLRFAINLFDVGPGLVTVSLLLFCKNPGQIRHRHDQEWHDLWREPD